MVEQQLRSLGLRLVTDGVRRPRGRPAPPKAGWESYLVAQKPVGEPWPDEAANRITAARKCYEAGTHEMVSLTTKEGWTQLYCKPRRQSAGRRVYFSDVTEAM